MTIGLSGTGAEVSFKRASEFGEIAERSAYELVSNAQTTGLKTLPVNIHAQNEYGMRPIHVAVQAGAVDELKEVLDRGADVLSLTRAGQGVGLFLDILKDRRGDESVHGRVVDLLNDHVSRSQPVNPDFKFRANAFNCVG